MSTPDTTVNMQQPLIELTSNTLGVNEPGEATSSAALVKSGTRQRPPTEKGHLMQDENARKHGKAFIKAYTTWAKSVKNMRTALKSFCSLEDLRGMKQMIQKQHNAISEHYELIQLNCTPNSDIVKKMDACLSITPDICEIVDKRLDTINQPFNEQLAKTLVRTTLNKDEYGSIFGNTNTETVISDDAEEVENRTHSRGTHPLYPPAPVENIDDSKSTSSRHSNASSKASLKKSGSRSRSCRYTRKCQGHAGDSQSTDQNTRRNNKTTATSGTKGHPCGSSKGSCF